MSEEVTLLTGLLDLGGQIALIAMLAWLLVMERREHAATRAEWHADITRCNDHMIDLLTQIAGIKANMYQVQLTQAQWESSHGESTTK